MAASQSNSCDSDNDTLSQGDDCASIILVLGVNGDGRETRELLWPFGRVANGVRGGVFVPILAYLLPWRAGDPVAAFVCATFLRKKAINENKGRSKPKDEYVGVRRPGRTVKINLCGLRLGCRCAPHVASHVTVTKTLQVTSQLQQFNLGIRSVNDYLCKSISVQV